MSDVEATSGGAPIGRRLFAAASAVWILLASWAQLAFTALAFGMCHGGCGDVGLKWSLILSAMVAVLVASIWLFVLALRGRVSGELAWGVAAIDVILPVLPFVYFRHL